MICEEYGWIRDATITGVAKRESSTQGGHIMCRTNKTGLHWIYLPRAYYMAVVTSLPPSVPNSRIAEGVQEFLKGRPCDVRMKHVIQDVASDGRLQHVWDAAIHLHMTPAMEDYRLGDGGHG